MAPRSASKGKGKAIRSSKDSEALNAVAEWTTWAMKKAKTIAHYGFIPLIIVVGMNSDPKPHFSQLITPV